MVNTFLNIVNPFNDYSDVSPVKFSHFIPYNQWEIEKEGHYIIDKSNGDKYLNDSPKVKKYKCAALAGATLIFHAIAIVLQTACRIASLITFSHFWYPNNLYSFKARSLLFGETY